MQLVFLILAATIVGFLIPRFRADLVALSSLLALYLTGLLTVPEAFAGFANSVVIMIAALFIVGEGVFQTGLAQKAGTTLLKGTGNSEFRLTIFMMVLVAVLSGFISNTGTVAILLPVVVSLCQQLQIHPSRLLMPLAFASSMGGALTLIGTAPNLIARQSLIDSGFEGLHFFSFTPLGLIFLFTGIAFLWFFGRKRLDKPHEQETGGAEPFNVEELLEQYQAIKYIHPIRVPAENESVGKVIKELQWPSKYDVTVLEVIKSKKRRLPVGPSYTIEANDVLIIYADEQAVARFVEGINLEKLSHNTLDGHLLEGANLAEVILTPTSRLTNQSLKDISFREKYGLTVLALRHQYEEARRHSYEEKLKYGDALLVYGKWDDIDLLSKEKSDMVVLKNASEPAVEKKKPDKSTIAGLIILGMLVLMVFEVFPVVITVVIAAMIMVLTGCVRHTDQAYRSINWQTVVLIASMLPMATALEKTGGIEFLSETLIGSLGIYGPLAVLAGLYVVTSIFSQFISNTATAVLLFPVAILTAQQMGVSPMPMVMAVAYSASMAFATPVATPPNAMVMAAGKYTFLDFVRVGVPLQITIAIIAVLLIPVFFPF
ncbi:hypothetical protein BHF68_03975 [Desulfuribacillus alkaliarsenatis]|uniref:RCK C-terminal domain-containing protein n=2 Tax=Desulfuribacillus alkaliarsenatis TaxID=766136 RepID=A0A1E5G3C1_9FIRM|nr:hypothetical protein BHF68_03975 [Desulfuribacillus alkaliarsenatis]